MALNFLALPQDPVSDTAIKRKFGKQVRGELAHDLECEQYRSRIFLPRNMTRVLTYHDRNRVHRADVTGTFGVSTRRCGPYLGSGPVNGKPIQKGIPSDRISSNTTPIPTKSEDDDSIQQTQAIPDTTSISTSCLKVKTQSDSFDMPQRRSLRTTLTKQHEDKNAQLFFNILNIRKKLNFKETKPELNSRPRKRVKRESVNCHCHVTIWDNRESLEQKEPIIRKSEFCSVTTTQIEDNSYLTEIELDAPFIFQAKELRVPLDSKNGSVLGMSDKYFLEVKIIPTADNVDWPPIPILGRSEGEQSHKLGQLAAEKLQGSLVARYLHLPQVPQPDIPLGVFFLKNGRTHRSKYGMDVNSYWIKAESVPESFIKKEHQDESFPLWTLDNKNQPFGRPQKTEPSKVASLTSKPKVVTKPRSEVKITFIVEPAGSSNAPRGFRNAVIHGFQCPTCLKRIFNCLDELQFHFLTFHSKHKFVVEKQCFFPNTDELESLSIKISSIPFARPRRLNRDRSTKDNKGQLINGDQMNPTDEDLLARDNSWAWLAPQEPFDLPRFIDGDRSWTGDQVKKNLTNSQTAPTIQDPISEIRRARGFVPAERVLPFRKNTATKYPNIKLTRLVDDRSDMYTSVSNRKVSVSEDPRSESDDEIDDDWLAQKTLEVLDVTADKHGWSDEERLLRSKWNKARLDEKLSHPRYLSDCLIRFIRAEHHWLTSDNIKIKTSFAKFLDELLQRRVISEDIVRDVWHILHETSNVETKATLANGHVDVHMHEAATNNNRRTTTLSRQERADALLSVPSSNCGICKDAIDDIDTRGVVCCELECEAPGVWYHARCARCKLRSKLDWRCGLCIERMAEIVEERNKDKGKGKSNVLVY